MAAAINNVEKRLKTTARSIEEVENIVHLLNYRWYLSAMALWTGDKPPFETDRIYEGYEDVLSLETIRHVEKIADARIQNRLKYALIDHYLQRRLLPHENEMKTWMKGAAAEVNGEKIYFRGNHFLVSKVKFL